MATKRAYPTLSGLAASDSEGEERYVDDVPTPDSAIENKKGRRKPTATAQTGAEPSKTTKPKISARRTSGRSNSNSATVANKGKRKALAEKTNQQHVSETEEVDEFDHVMEDENAVSGDELGETRRAVPGKKSKISGTAGRYAPHANAKAKAGKDFDKPPRITKQKGAKKKVAAGAKSLEKVILETQLPAVEMQIDESTNENEDCLTISGHDIAAPRGNSTLRQDATQPRRPGSVSDTEVSGPSIRRKLGDMTKKFENLELRYRDLKEIGVEEAKRNFDRLQKQTEQKTAVANNLIASLKADLAAQSSIAKQSQVLQKTLDSQASEVTRLRTQVNELSTSLKDAQFENNSLSAKLAAKRNVATSIESTYSRISESAKKANGVVRMVGTAEAAQAAQAAQLKEDLYSDLTGLIMRSVKRESEEDIFDCIQTGRNRTLHFKLGVANEKLADSYDNAQCIYTPQLDLGRDKALISLLPDYLTDEITFPRPQAAKFYARILQALSERPS